MLTSGGRSAQFGMPVGAKPEKLGPEHNPWFWNPNRGSYKSAPGWFQDQLQEIDKGLAVIWNPIMERWLVWNRAPRINHPLCQGWRLLFIHKDIDGSYLPLDERLFARLFAASVDRDGTALKYFDRVAAEMQRDREKAEAQSTQDSIDHAMETFNHSQISVSMAGKSNGSKFSTYHA